jgi:hypothetical protein
VVDRARVLRGAGVVGCVLVALGTSLHGVAPRPAVALCAVGNALFHVGAGGMVLQLAGGWAALAGLFVGPGDLGVLWGTNAGRGLWPTGTWPFVLLCMASVVPLLALGRVQTACGRGGDAARRAAPSTGRKGWGLVLVLSLLSLAVVLRSVGATWVSAAGPASAGVVAGLYIAAFGAKCIGGFLADRLGWLVIAVGAAAAALPLLALGSMSGWLAITTAALVALPMPVTLAAISRLYPTRPAFAFGLTTFWVYLGGPPFAEPLVHPGVIWLACAAQGACVATLLLGLLLLPGDKRLGPTRASSRGPGDGLKSGGR